MDIGKSVIIALRDKGKNKRWLAFELAVTPATVTTLCKNTSCTGPMLERLCTVFESKASEFIALGE
jgi:plasmid maintenance system antidote protein VapI